MYKIVQFGGISVKKRVMKPSCQGCGGDSPRPHSDKPSVRKPKPLPTNRKTAQADAWTYRRKENAARDIGGHTRNEADKNMRPKSLKTKRGFDQKKNFRT
jgi:hypothetical protein